MELYKWLDENLPSFLDKLGIDSSYSESLITAHGDKCEIFKGYFEENGLDYFHGVAIYLVLSFEPYSDEVRDTKNGWVSPFEWIVKNQNQFITYFEN